MNFNLNNIYINHIIKISNFNYKNQKMMLLYKIIKFNQMLLNKLIYI